MRSLPSPAEPAAPDLASLSPRPSSQRMLAPSPPCSWARDNRALGTLLNGPRQRPVKWGVDLAALLRDLAETYASRAKQGGVNFNLEIESDPVNIKGDAAQLGTLIQNLLDNAIKFTLAGGQVNVKLSTQNEAVQLSVADTGIGIPGADMPHLFSRFHRGRNASAYPGSGLGLAIVKTIVDQHGASIRVDSDTTGTVFVIRFIPYQSGS